jgi:hypothetical protein
MYIYILELSNKKYYIGKTNNPKFRIQEHLEGAGSTWTKKYQPKKLIDLVELKDKFDEDNFTFKYMEKYGIDNVRGGSFCSEKLSQENKEVIQKIINSSSDKCFKCGQKGHFVSDCKVFLINNDEDDEDDEDDEEYYIYQCSYCGKEFETEKGVRFHENVYCHKKKSSSYSCYRCGRKGHYSNECYARTDIDGNEL